MKTKNKKNTNIEKLGILAVAGLVLLIVAVPVLGQTARTGVSRPAPALVADPGQPRMVPAKPSAATPFPATGVTGTPLPTASSYVPGPAASSLAAAPVYLPFTVTGGNAFVAGPQTSTPESDDIDAGIVTRVPSRPGEVPDGTVLKVKMRQTLSTGTTRVGTVFSAEVTEPVLRDGRVIIPAGAVLDGRVTMVRGGRRFSGTPALHLEPNSVTLPDGTHYGLHARVIDTDRWGLMKVDDEGTILRRDWTKSSLAAMALTTGGGAAAGAMIGSWPGALIGAGVGAGAGTVVMLKQNRQEELPRNAGLVFCLTAPMVTTPLSAAAMPEVMGRPSGD